MGANAVTTVPVYASGEVLTAADLNITNSGIPVFATTVERNAAFGGTGEKTLAEGQFAYLEDTNTTQYYDGATWQAVGTTAGIVCVKAETSFSAVTTLNVDNVFTSSYTNYKILINLTAGSGSITMRLRAASTDTTTNYQTRNVYGTSSLLFAANPTGTDDIYLFDYDTTSGGGSEINVFAPQLAQKTAVTCMASGSSAAAVFIYSTAASHTASTQFDGFSLFIPSAMTGTYAVYGYSKTV